MEGDFQIIGGIRLVQDRYDCDLHNYFDFRDLLYSVEQQTVVLRWERSRREGVSPALPSEVRIEYRGVLQFRFEPRNQDLPFSEDCCLASFGYWTDEEWAGREIIIEPHPGPESDWLTAISFMSGALLILQARSAHAVIVE